jgi:hypothetical protein
MVEMIATTIMSSMRVNPAFFELRIIELASSPWNREHRRALVRSRNPRRVHRCLFVRRLGVPTGPAAQPA